MRYSKNKIVIFGTGEASFRFVEKLYNIDLGKNILFFVDNNPQKWGTTFLGFRVECPDYLLKYDDNFFIVVASMYFNQIEIQLKNFGFTKEDDYLDANEFYERNIIEKRVERKISIIDENIKNNEWDNAIKDLNSILPLAPFNNDLISKISFCYEQIGDATIANAFKEQLRNNSHSKIKIAIFLREGQDSFVEDIIHYLSFNYTVKKIYVSYYNQINIGMDWADICWFEFCSDLIRHASKSKLAIEKKIVCRLHSSEAFTSIVNEINWNVVDKLIFVSKTIKDYVINQGINLDENQVEIIPNGVNLERYSYKVRNPGFNIAFVGRINFKKGPMLLLQSINVIKKIDNRFKLYIAGKFEEARYELYFNQMIKEMGLEESVIIEGWISDIDNWLEDKNYVISTSLLESQHMAIMEAMAKGIKPLVHNFYGAREIYNNQVIWNDMEQLVDLIKNNYNSKEYYHFVERKYSLEKTNVMINRLIDNVMRKNKKKKNYNINYKNKNIKFYLPNPEDYIQKVIIDTESFYELDMLKDIEEKVSNNDLILDVGANIGNHSIHFAKICNCNVLSFEPQKEVFSILNENIRLNNLSSLVKAYNIGIGARNTKGNLTIIDKNNSGTGKIEFDENGEIIVKTLDSILKKYTNINDLKIIKIDVEGRELEVLQGARGIINKFNPMIYIEIQSSNLFEEISLFLSKYGYKVKKSFNGTPTFLFAIN